MDKILQTYLRRLVNLSSNNRSILLLRLVSEQFIDIHDFNFLNKEPSFSFIEKLIGRKKKIPICKIVDSRDDQSNEVSRKIKRLLRINKFIYEEQGSRDLYVGWPFIRGKFSDGTLVRAPLLFFPVSLEIENNNWNLILREEINITFNKAFLLAYSYFNKVKLDEELIERTFDDYDPDSTVFRTEIYQTFRDSPVDINFNPDNFANTLVAFKNFTKAEFEKHEQNGELKLYPEAVLGIFPQAGSNLVPDYLDMIEWSQDKDMEEFFLKRSGEVDKNQLRFPFLDQIREEETFTPFKIDAFQENALKAVKKGNSIVVQGPPGTGKSQLICNLISDFIARNKTVLVVSQKRAALDVVFKRMKDKEVSDFMALVHDFKTDRKLLYDKIALQINRIDDYKMMNNSLDAIQLERTFQQASRRIDQITEELEEFKFALFDTEECGISAKELYLTSNKDITAVNLRQEYKNFSFNHLDDFKLKFESYVDLKGKFNVNHDWANRKSFAGYGLTELKRMQELIEEIPVRAYELSEAMKGLLGHPLQLDEIELINEKKDELEGILVHLKKDDFYEIFKLAADFPDSETEVLWISNTERVIMDCFSREGIEASLPSQELGKFQEVLQNSFEARKNPFKYLKWLLFSKDKYYLKRVIVANQLKQNSEGLKTLVKRIDNRLNVEHNLTKLREKSWVPEIPDKLEKINFQIWFENLRMAVKAKISYSSLRPLRERVTPSSFSRKEFIKKVRQVMETADQLTLWKGIWETYLLQIQIQKLYSGEVKEKALIKSLQRDFDDLCEFDNLIENLTVDEKNVIDRVIEKKIEPREPLDPWGLFDNSLRLAWINHIESKYPILRSVSSIKFRKLESELRAKIKEKLKVSNDILLLRIRERTYQNVLYNRLKNRITYRDLHHQVTKKKKIWPLRKLIAHFSDELANLMPCWLASPESVSALFPMETVFDLVIFDEASQTFTEKGIPAMYRGRQIVIAGDNKQLRPNDLYKVRWEDEEEDPTLEVDSLLELAERYLMNVTLQSHYRSQSLELIDFSNRNFYDNKLNLLPDRLVLNRHEPAIKFTKVNGIWEDNKNEAEAKEVSRIVFEILKRTPDKQIGIVTFNARQQMHIMDVLEEQSIKHERLLPETLFVKNIENVQGDERDIIIFSTGYGPTPHGKIILQFGPLNNEGGENRLNVAVTRAREKIHIISSLLPQQLNTSDTKNPGPKLLKEYLAYAYEVSNGKFESAPPFQGFKSDWYLKDKIRPMISELSPQLQVTNQLPFADLTVRKGKDYEILFVTDDELYYEGLSMKQIHAYKPFAFGSKHWKVKGVFSRELWNDSEKLKDEIRLFVHQNINLP